MPPETLDQDGITWIELKQAAKHSRTAARAIGEAIKAGSIACLVVADKTYIPLSAANRLKRETSLMRGLQRKTKVGDTIARGGRFGPLSAHREKQDVLPTSSGRRGRGWIGEPSKS